LLEGATYGTLQIVKAAAGASPAKRGASIIPINPSKTPIGRLYDRYFSMLELGKRRKMTT
jgi:hypothetical protein